MGRLTRTRPVVKVRAGVEGRVARRSDTLAVEEPLEVPGVLLISGSADGVGGRGRTWSRPSA